MNRKISTVFALMVINGSFLIGKAYAQTYCTPAYTTGCSTGATIDTVALVGDNNTGIYQGAACNTTGYEDFTALTPPDLTAGQNYTLDFNVSNPSLFTHTDGRAWIDFNDDGTFDNNSSGEEVLGSQNSATTFSFSFTVPAGTPTGDYRLRIRTRSAMVVFAGDIDPCANITTGEAEDFMVHVTNSGSTTTCFAPTGLSESNITSDSVLLSWTGNAASFQLEYGPSGFLPGTGTMMTTAANLLPIGGLLPNTAYSFRVRAICSPGTDSSVWSGVYAFNTICDTPAVNLGSDTSFCQGTSITLSSGTSNTNDSYHWNTGSNSNTLTVHLPGTYSLTVTDPFLCSATDTIHLTINPLPTADGITQLSNTPDGHSTFAADNPQQVTHYFWDFGNGQTSTNDTAAVVWTSNGNYTIMLVVSNACGSDTLNTLVVVSDLGIGAVSPNNNQIQVYPNPARNTVTLHNTGEARMETLSIFNVLGQVVYQGSINGLSSYLLNVQGVSSGVYTVKVLLENGDQLIKRLVIQH